MKKHLTLFACIIICLSCSNNDNSGSGSDKLIGKWVESKITRVVDNSLIKENNITFEYKTTFHSDGKYMTGTDVGDLNGTWRNLGNSVYKLTMLGVSREAKFEFINDNEYRVQETYFDIQSGNNQQVYTYSVRVN
jgi:hypothetical protein